MNIEKVAGSKVKFEVIIPVETFKKALDKAFEVENAKVEIKGFRKGQAPRALYEAKFGVESLYPEALNEAINETYFEVVENEKIDVCGYPSIDLDQNKVNTKDPIHYTVTVSVYPEVTLGEYKNLGIEKEKVSVTAKEVEDEINRTLDRETMLIKKTGEDVKVEEGDTVVFDFKGFKDGVAFEGGEAKDYSLEIGSHQFIPGFEEQMVGMKENESKDLNCKFPEDYHAENLKGADVVFHVDVHEIKVKDKPELDDEFVKELKLDDVTTVEQYKKHVKEQIKTRKENIANDKAKNDLYQKVVENAKFELPEDLVAEEADYSFKQAEAQAKQYNMPLETMLMYMGQGSVEDYKKQLKDQATKSLGLRFVLKEIAKAENFDATEEEINTKFDEIAEQYKMTADQVKMSISAQAVKEEIVTQKAYKLVEDENPFQTSTKAKKSE